MRSGNPTTEEKSGPKPARRRILAPGIRIGLLLACGGGVAAWIAITSRYSGEPPPAPDRPRDVRYDNYRNPSGPWSIHVVRVPRHSRQFEISTAHATGKAIGLTPVTEQTAHLKSATGVPVAAINGDFYQREGPYAGDPRGLQVVQGELISAPKGGAGFWIDAAGQPHATNIISRMEVTWPDGSSSAIGLNESRLPDRVALYTPALGSSTGTKGGRELVLEPRDAQPWPPLRPGRTYRVRVREIRESADTPILAGTLVLSVGPAALKSLPRVDAGAEMSLTTATEPDLRGAKAAISGGPILLQRGQRRRFRTPDSDSYEFSSIVERHPRSAIGWNDDYFFLVVVDGRRKGVSEGMTLNELSAYLAELGCREGMNLDGGGSATLWYDGQVRNYLCDGYEREVANCLVVCRKAETTWEVSQSHPGGQAR
jgi:hypothetical protein